MKIILIVAATEAEVMGIRSYLQSMPLSIDNIYHYDILVTGVGIMAATYALTRYLNEHTVDYLIQVGIAGSFSPKINIGDMVVVASEAMGDSGAEDGDEYLDLFQMGLLSPNEYPYDNKLLFVPEDLPPKLRIDLPHVHSLTVNTTSGRESTIQMRRKRYAAQIESMEGAPFHFVCLQYNKPFTQIRCISNMVTVRDSSQWQIQKAIRILNEYIINNIIMS